jgi:hypothetical protein
MDSVRKPNLAAAGPCPKCGANIAYSTIVCTSCAAWRPHRGRSRPRRAAADVRQSHERRTWVRVALLVGSLTAAAAVAHATRVLSAARPTAPSSVQATTPDSVPASPR